ncbi:unnamed protein product [Candidula unifasciata]|uniref:Histone H2A n=1 Tax=Candidula unifasciata TaxID=100452 RepID=A0A8S3YVQ2_9EUPU|nr:unnamed protein product [Candidula unifasciata]
MSKSRSSRTGLQFIVGRTHPLPRNVNYAEYAVLEYLDAEVLELAGNAACDNEKTGIIPRNLQLTIRNDEELKRCHYHSESCAAVHPGCAPAGEVAESHLQEYCHCCTPNKLPHRCIYQYILKMCCL